MHAEMLNPAMRRELKRIGITLAIAGGVVLMLLVGWQWAKLAEKYSDWLAFGPCIAIVLWCIWSGVGRKMNRQEDFDASFNASQEDPPDCEPET